MPASRGKVRKDRVGIEREPGGRLGSGRVAGQVAAAAAELAARSARRSTPGEKGKADPGVIFEAAVLDRVDRHLEPGCRPWRARRARRRAAPARCAPAPARSRRSSAASAASAGPAAASSRPSNSPASPANAATAAASLWSSAARNAAARSPGDAVGLGHRRNQGRQGDVDRQMRHAERGQRLAGDRDRLDIGGATRRRRSARRRPGRSGARAGSREPLTRNTWPA